MQECQESLLKCSKQVQDDASTIPAHDLQIYSKVTSPLCQSHLRADRLQKIIKDLAEKFERLRKGSGPKRKFEFKSVTTKNKVGASKKEPESSSTLGGILDTPLTKDSERREFSEAKVDESKDGTSEAAPLKPPPIAKSGLAIQSLYDESYVTAARDLESSATIRDVHRSLVDMSHATTQRTYLNTLAINDVRQSVILCGTVIGAAQITGLRGTTLVLNSGQFRAHDCIDCVFYITCNSRPIIEHCSNVQFAQAPAIFVSSHPHVKS